MTNFHRINQTVAVLRQAAGLRRQAGDAPAAAGLEALAAGMPALAHSRTYAQFSSLCDTLFQPAAEPGGAAVKVGDAWRAYLMRVGGDLPLPVSPEGYLDDLLRIAAEVLEGMPDAAVVLHARPAGTVRH